MKKVLVLFVAISLFVLSAGTSLANDGDATVSVLDRHAVWTKTSDEKNRPGYSHQANMGISKETPEAMSNAVSTDNSWDEGIFRFLNETKYYDFVMDHKRSSS